MKKLWILLGAALCLGYLVQVSLSPPLNKEACAYPHFLDNPHLDARMRTLMAPHLLPLDHPVKQALDTLFSKSWVIENKESLQKAGFTIIASMPFSFVTVVRHPEIPGYVFKLYLDSETRTKNHIPHHEWLARRCIGAERIRKIISQKKLKFFTVPDKWLYLLPLRSESHEPVIVMETEMQLESEPVSRAAWKTLVSSEHLNELYTILKQGCGTTTIGGNVPYTKQGLFAFIDTEYPQRQLRLRKVRSYLSEEMQRYWNDLTGNRDSRRKTKKNNRSLDTGINGNN